MADPTAGLPVGRGRERAQLVSAMERGLAGDPGLTVVCGEAGIGKTTLVEDLARVARDRHVRVVNGWADERDLSAFGLWRGPCRQLNLAMGELDESLPPLERRWELLGDLTETLERAGPCSSCWKTSSGQTSCRFGPWSGSRSGSRGAQWRWSPAAGTTAQGRRW